MENSWKELEQHGTVAVKVFSSTVLILLLLPVTVLAQQACMFNAPSGATFLNDNLGHVGWGFQNDTSTTWYFGATENGNSNFYVPAGGDTETWMSQGLDTDMYAAFKSAGYFHGAGYYTLYRCIIVVSAVDVNSALVMQATTATDGYNVLSNNCLTKAVDILKAYGDENLVYNDVAEAPNDYFNNSLASAGWGMIQAL